jgi:hypothetical protein
VGQVQQIQQLLGMPLVAETHILQKAYFLPVGVVGEEIPEMFYRILTIMEDKEEMAEEMDLVRGAQ